MVYPLNNATIVNKHCEVYCYRSADQNTTENTIWGLSRKYKRRQILKILAAHIMNYHMVEAAPHHVGR